MEQGVLGQVELLIAGGLLGSKNALKICEELKRHGLEGCALEVLKAALKEEAARGGGKASGDNVGSDDEDGGTSFLELAVVSSLRLAHSVGKDALTAHVTWLLSLNGVARDDGSGEGDVVDGREAASVGVGLSCKSLLSALLCLGNVGCPTEERFRMVPRALRSAPLFSFQLSPPPAVLATSQALGCLRRCGKELKCGDWGVDGEDGKKALLTRGGSTQPFLKT